VDDATRFVSAFCEPIAYSPLHIYRSALLFTPHQTLLHRKYSSEIKFLVGVTGRHEGVWGPCINVIEGHSEWVNSVAFSNDGTRVVSGSLDSTVRVWDSSSGTEVLRLDGHNSYVNSVAFSSDGSRIVSGSRDKTVRVWDSPSGAEVMKLIGHSAGVLSVAFSKDGTRIVSGSQDNTARVWDSSSGAEVLKLDGHSRWVYSVAFSNDDAHIVSGHYDNTVHIWDSSSGAEMLKLDRHSLAVRSVAFSNDDTCIVSASDDRTIRVWNSPSGAELFQCNHEEFIQSVAFLNGNTHIVVNEKSIVKLEGALVPGTLSPSTTSSVSEAANSTQMYTLGGGWVLRISDDGSKEKVLWLPAHIRGESDSHGNYLVVGTGLGKIYILDFSNVPM
jgi:WD40 repeat protein